MITVREAELRDIPALMRLHERLVAYENSLGRTPYAPDENVRKNALVELAVKAITGPDALIILGEKDNRKVIGYLCAAVQHQFEFMRHHTVVYLISMGIDQALPIVSRGKLIMMGMQKLAKWATDKNATEMVCRVHHRNEPMRRVIRKLGFRADYLQYNCELTRR